MPPGTISHKKVETFALISALLFLSLCAYVIISHSSRTQQNTDENGNSATSSSLENTDVNFVDGPLPTDWPYFGPMHKYMMTSDDIYPVILIDTSTPTLVQYPREENKAHDFSSTTGVASEATDSSINVVSSASTSSGAGSVTSGGSRSASKGRPYSRRQQKRGRRDELFEQFLEDARRQHREIVESIYAAVAFLRDMRE